MRFEWDERKRAANLAKHGLDFRLAILVFDGGYILEPARPVGDELREKAIGMVLGRMVAVILTRREGAVRVISMRRARENERRAYQAIYG
ncbi:BrnT family toxin [Siccirubricoccus sp. G192]|uniref:BrnT family toxin n=1 Tax=Siccirubricoccus sp. G192 TaxID=2849651 RepID=UPI001C2C2CF0|nr:BrnT family toxin [Siccirubricoccus sp. G192]MBV1797287.1 BrnT family toxin [Siccirubricoccus sp. G192]